MSPSFPPSRWECIHFVIVTLVCIPTQERGNESECIHSHRDGGNESNKKVNNNEHRKNNRHVQRGL